MANVTESDLPLQPSLPLGKYRHYKGNLYEVLGVTLHSETLEWHVIYRALYGDQERRWIRPFDMFVSDVEINGVTIKRFTYLPEAD